MQWDEEGFPYPHINEQCVDCGKCIQICPLITTLSTYGGSLDQATVYAVWSNDEECRIQSTSGGLFSELAISVYEKKGVVVGAVYDESFMIHHETSESPEDLRRLRQSKYAQSDIRLVFREIKIFLDAGRMVLFCGTPCQAAGLRAYLGGVPEQLLLCDFICRGINSPKAYSAYLRMLEKKHGAPAKMIQFKNKDKGWNQFHTKVIFENGSVHHQDRNTDPFMQSYLKYNLIIRPCCHVCRFKEEHRNVDLTLGDFWGVGNYAPELDNNKGTSVVIASTEKGARVIDSLEDRISSRLMKLEQVHLGNVCLRKSVVAGPNRGKFLRNLDRLGFDEAMNRYARDPIHMQLYQQARRIKAHVKRSLGR
jgi:coenzyme F420-reducing hydrogenase beta subunit